MQNGDQRINWTHVTIAGPFQRAPQKSPFEAIGAALLCMVSPAFTGGLYTWVATTKCGFAPVTAGMGAAVLGGATVIAVGCCLGRHK